MDNFQIDTCTGRPVRHQDEAKDPAEDKTMSMRAPPKSNKPKNRRHESAGDKLIAQSVQLQNKLVLEVT